ncbi:MAG: DJ-1/PfpI family protein [Gallionella sp.]|nr:DJ-1/PfpI family protein [Gallionella sp.]
MTSGDQTNLSIVLFDQFELLDVCGPLEMFGKLTDHFQVAMVGSHTGPIVSAQGPRMLADYSYSDAATPEIVLVPGGWGTRRLVDDKEFLTWLVDWASKARYVTSVCTGSGVLAAAGLLDGYRATSNKRAFKWAQSQGPRVEWLPEARWVEDRNRWTSSGVAAGMDMALALIEHLRGGDVALSVADQVEYEWHRDSTWDPFAAKNGLVP